MLKCFSVLLIFILSFSALAEEYQSTDNQGLSKYERINHIEESLTSYSKNIQDGQTQLAQLKENLQALKQNSDSAQSELKLEIKQLQNEIKILKEEMESLKKPKNVNK